MNSLSVHQVKPMGYRSIKVLRRITSHRQLANIPRGLCFMTHLINQSNPTCESVKCTTLLHENVLKTFFSPEQFNYNFFYLLLFFGRTQVHVSTYTLTHTYLKTMIQIGRSRSLQTELQRSCFKTNNEILQPIAGCFAE